MKRALIAVLGEVRKGLLITWTYRADTLGGLLTLAFVFLGISFMIGDGQLEAEPMARFLLGYVAWMYAMSAIGDLSYGLRSEMSAGTLEQMAMSPLPLGLMLMGRVLASLLVSTAEVLALSVAARRLFEVRIPMRWEGVPVLVLMLVGVFGFGFVIAGLVLVYKQSGSFANLVQNGLLFLNGSILPVDNMPGWLSGFAKTLPSTQGVVVLRQVVLEGRSLAALWQDGSLVWLVVHSAAWFAVGWLVFGVCQGIAKRQGSLGQY